MLNSVLRFIQYITYTIKLNKIKIEEPEYVLPVDQSYAIRSLIRNPSKWYSCYKWIPSKEHMVYTKIKITKVPVNFDNLSYKNIFSSWLSDKSFVDRSLLKFSDDDVEYMFDSLKEQLYKTDNASLLKTYENSRVWYQSGLSYRELESLFVNNKNNPYIQEFILDMIYKVYPDELYTLIDVIYSDEYSNYIQTYYTKLILFLFDIIDFSKLVNYYGKLEAMYTNNNNINIIKWKLLGIIQRRSVLEVKMEESRKLRTLI